MPTCPGRRFSAGIPEWWGALEEILAIGDVDPAPTMPPVAHTDAAAAEILNDENSDVRAILQAAEEKTKREWLDEYHKQLGA